MWALESATQIEKGSYYALITAKVFTIFMFEGVIHHLGETLSPSWSERIGKKPVAARESLPDRHKTVRRLLGRSNDASDFQSIQTLVQRLTDFRDSLAHPKVVRETFKRTVKSPDEAKMELGLTFDASEVPGDFKRLEAYSLELVDTAAALLETTDWDEGRAKYPHLQDLEFEAGQLRCVLHISASYSGSSRILAHTPSQGQVNNEK
jgi:hypothetical protein